MEGPIQDYSSGYYAIELRATAFESGPTIDSELYKYIEDVLYANTDAPVWIRAGFDGNPYFKLQTDGPLPRDLIGLPHEWMEDFGLQDDGKHNFFFICKPGHAHYVSQSVLWGDTYDREDEE